MKALLKCSALALVLAALGVAHAQGTGKGAGQAWPTKPVRFIAAQTLAGNSAISNRTAAMPHARRRRGKHSAIPRAISNRPEPRTTTEGMRHLPPARSGAQGGTRGDTIIP